MTTLRHKIVIDAPIEAVWQVVGDLVAVERYNPMVASAKLISTRREGVGAKRRCELKPNGWVEEAVWDWNPPHAIGLEVAATEWPVVFMKWRTELQQEGAGTVVRQEIAYKMKFGPLGALMDALIMRRRLDRSIADIFGSLKRYVETSVHSGR